MHHIESDEVPRFNRLTMERKIFLKPGEQVTVVAGAKQPGRPLISEEERRAQAARRHVLRQARDAARQLSLGLRHLQGGDPDTKSSFTMEAEGRLGKLAKELQRHGITREQLVAEICNTYRKASPSANTGGSL
jgi:hypothetical protein